MGWPFEAGPLAGCTQAVLIFLTLVVGLWTVGCPHRTGHRPHGERSDRRTEKAPSERTAGLPVARDGHPGDPRDRAGSGAVGRPHQAVCAGSTTSLSGPPVSGSGSPISARMLMPPPVPCAGNPELLGCRVLLG